MRRRATITYKAGDEMHHEQVWVQNLQQTDIQGNSVIMKLYKDEDNNAVLTSNDDNVDQYQISLPVKDGAYAYIPVNAMKALVAMNSVRTMNDNETWIRLNLDPIQPSIGMFNSAEPVKEL